VERVLTLAGGAFFLAMRSYASMEKYTRVAKPALGRGLGKLMKEAQAPSSSDPVSKPGPAPTGVATLIRGGKSPAKPSLSIVQPLAKPQPRGGEAARGQSRSNLPMRISLVLADVVMIGLVARIAFARTETLGWLELTLCIAAMVLGAWLACLALWPD
jgi:hypothetical protein